MARKRTKASAAAEPDALVSPATEGPQPAAPAAEPEQPEPERKNGRIARTRVKYEGTWYAPGEEVPFKGATDAEAYGDALVEK